MADSPNVSVVRRLYQARGNPDVMRQVLAREVRWEVVDGTEFFEAGAHVIALGSYAGRARRSGKRFPARFAHV